MIRLSEHGGIFGGILNLNGSRLIDFYLSNVEPTPKNIGDVWIETDKDLDIGNIIISDLEPINGVDRQIWQQVVDLNYKFNLENVSATFNRSEIDLVVNIDRKTISDRSLDDKIHLWRNPLIDGYGELFTTYFWDTDKYSWARLNASFWNGSSWVRFSNTTFILYDSGTEYIEWIPNSGYASTTSKFSDSFRLWSEYRENTGTSNAGFSTSISVNVTTFNRIHVDAKYVSKGRVYYYIEVFAADGTTLLLRDTETSLNSNNLERIVDIQEITGNAIIKVSMIASYHGSSQNGFVYGEGDTNIYNIRLE